jgi:hypothetical protein
MRNKKEKERKSPCILTCQIKGETVITARNYSRISHQEGGSLL